MYQAGFGGDVGSELKLNTSELTDCAHSFRVYFVWKLTSFNCMQNVVKMFVHLPVPQAARLSVCECVCVCVCVHLDVLV